MHTPSSPDDTQENVKIGNIGSSFKEQNKSKNSF